MTITRSSTRPGWPCSETTSRPTSCWEQPACHPEI